MKNLIKNSVIVLLSIITLGSMTSCSDDSSEGAPVEPQEPRMVSLGFDGLFLESKGAQAKGGVDISHFYEYKGYTVNITGGISPEYATNTDVDLEAGLQVEVVGDIQVTVFHPSFDGQALSTIAYYGVENDPLDTSIEDAPNVNTKLVQTFVYVTEEVEGLINSLTIRGIDADKNVAYYTAVIDNPVVIQTVGDTLYGDTQGVIGGGVRYTVVTNGQDLIFDLPEFTAPIDGGLTPVPPAPQM